MKIGVQVCRILVGILFIVSGLVKANDPLGLSYKMQEFFEIWNGDLTASSFFFKNILIQFFSFLHSYSLTLSVIMITLEIMAGVALLLGWQRRLVVNLLLFLIIFFTFLTGYAYASGKFKNCGCFGDCLPITPLTSFVKDLVLLILIIILAAGKKYIQSIKSNMFRSTIMGISLLLTLGLQWYVLNYLPLVDCLPFKKGANITEGMKIPAGAVPDSFAIRFVYEKSGKQYEFSPTDLPNDLETYNFVDRIDKLIRKGNAEPPIKGFSLIDVTGSDSTNLILNQPKAILLFCEDFKKPLSRWITDFKKLQAQAQQQNIPVYIVTTMVDKAQQIFNKEGLGALPVLGCDYTAVRTAARTNPTLYLLQQGTVYNKYSFRQIDHATNDLKKL